MLKYLKQNKQVIVVAMGLFIVSMSALFFFVGANPELEHKELATSVLHVAPEKPLPEIEEHYRELLKTPEDPIMALTINGSIDFTSPGFEALLGYAPSELQHQVIFNLINPEDLSIFLGGFGKVLQNEPGVTIVGPYRLRTKQGNYHLYIGSAVPVMVKGKIEKIALAVKDITHQLNDEKGSDALPENSTGKGKKIRNDNSQEQNRMMAEKNEQEE